MYRDAPTGGCCDFGVRLRPLAVYCLGDGVRTFTNTLVGD